MYLDDIVVYHSDPVQVWHKIKLVLEHLAATGFMLNTVKSHYLASGMKMLLLVTQGA